VLRASDAAGERVAAVKEDLHFHSHKVQERLPDEKIEQCQAINSERPDKEPPEEKQRITGLPSKDMNRWT
jgi:hypothetical protein